MSQRTYTFVTYLIFIFACKLSNVRQAKPSARPLVIILSIIIYIMPASCGLSDGVRVMSELERWYSDSAKPFMVFSDSTTGITVYTAGLAKELRERNENTDEKTFLSIIFQIDGETVGNNKFAKERSKHHETKTDNLIPYSLYAGIASGRLR